MDEVKLAFSRLQPLCVAVVQSSTEENIANLQGELEENAKVLAPGTLQDMQNYILFPIQFNLKKPCREKIDIALLRLLNVVLKNTRVTSHSLFGNLYMELLARVSDYKCGGFKDVTEDLKLQVVASLKALLLSLDQEILEKLYSEELKLPLSQGVYILVKFVENESLKALRVEAMEVLAMLADGPEGPARERFMQFLPGVTMALTKVLRDHDTQVHWVLNKALDVWAQVVTLVLPDKMIPTYGEEKVKDISGKLKILISTIAKLVTFSHWKVRISLLKWVCCLLQHCFLTLQDSLVFLVNVPLSLCFDEVDAVKDESLKMIEQFSKVHLRKCEVLDKFKQEVAVAVAELPKNIKGSASDDDIRTELAVINGYFVLLGQNMGEFYAEKLVGALVVLAEQDISGITLLHSQPTTVDPTIPLEKRHLKWPRKTFKHFRDEERIGALFESLCGNIARSDNVYCAVDQLLQQAAFRPHAILVINLIARHLPPGHYVSSMMEDYLAADPDIHQGPSKPRESKENLLKKCLVLEGMAKVAEVCKKDFKVHLLRCLFLVVESVGSPYSHVSHTAYIALCSIALSCGYGTLSELIVDNLDYLIHAIFLKLRHHSHKTAMVLKALLHLSSSNILALVEDLVKDMLRELDDHYADKDIAVNYMSVLFTFVECVQKWYPRPNKVDTAAKKPETFKDIMDKYAEKKKQKEIQEQLAEGEEMDPKEECTRTEEENVAKKKQPLHIDLTLEIMKRCIHLQHDSVQDLSLLALDTIGAGSRALAEHPDSLLPMVHKVWAPLVQRFSAPNLVVWRRAWAVLARGLAPCTGDFLSKRVMAEVWPRVADFLRSQAGVSRRNHHSQAHKLQLDILQDLATLAASLDLRELQLERLCRAALPYLHPEQPLALQRAARQSCQDLAALDPDLVWFVTLSDGLLVQT